jgi:hypothetical protein
MPSSLPLKKCELRTFTDGQVKHYSRSPTEEPRTTNTAVATRILQLGLSNFEIHVERKFL